MTPTWLMGAAAALVVAYLFRGLLLPLLLAGTLAYLLTPVVTWAEAFAIRRSVAVAGLYVGFLVVLTGGGVLLGPMLRDEAAGLAEDLPTLAGRVEAGLDMASRELAEAVPALRRWLPGDGTAHAWTERLIEGRGGGLGDVLEHAGYLFILAILVPFFAFFLLRDSRGLVARLMDRLPPAYVETSVAVLREIDGIIGRYIRGVVLDGLAVGTLAALALWPLGVPYPLLLGAFAGLANAIPFLGPLLSAVAAGLVVLTHGQGLGAVLHVALVFLVIKALDDAVIQPLTIGRKLHLHPMLLLASVVAGNQALGILGMVIAVPAVTVVQETARLLIEHHRRRTTLGPTPAVASAAATYLC